MSLSDPLGLETEKRLAKQLAVLIVERDIQGEMELMLLKEWQFSVVTHNASAAKLLLSSLTRVQHLRRAKTPADIAQAVEFFHK